MLNYIRSECYRTIRSRSYVIFFGACAVLLVLTSLFMRNTEPFNNTSVSLALTLNTFNMVSLLTIGVADMVFCNEYKNQTFKNALAYGYSRNAIYLGKFATEVIFAFGIAIAVFGIYLLSVFLLLENPPEARPMVESYFLLLLGSVPVWLGCLALAHLCLFFVRGGTAASFLFAGLLVIPDSVFALLGMKEGFGPFCTAIRENLLWNQIGHMTTPMMMTGQMLTPDQLIHPALVGLGHMVVLLLIGMALFRRKEI
ncbi:ABC transporter permease [Bacilliculturomica massiliensis]|uniref:ABC transporter permease n=1 Tax=Bacilliculturomica massiliensis TaxID=1917867 RepID=UPI0013EF338F|nr:ABC transporter permease [Bacilliculturomica massiliensis]